MIFNGDPPYSLWEHPPAIGRIPPHRTDAGAFLLAECFGCRVADAGQGRRRSLRPRPEAPSDARFIDEIAVAELQERDLETLPFDRVLLDLLENARLVRPFQIINGHEPDRLSAALAGEHVGTIVHADR